jgi:hypothetical protein
MNNNAYLEANGWTRAEVKKHGFKKIITWFHAATDRKVLTTGSALYAQMNMTRVARVLAAKEEGK